MINIAVFDNNSSNREAIKNALVKYTFQNQIDLDVFWFFENCDIKKIQQYAPTIQIAFVSLDLKENAKICSAIYQSNEDCRIVFYSALSKNIEPLLRFRPCRFQNNSGEELNLEIIMDEIVSELKNSKCYFYYENKRQILLIPLKAIVFFQSDLKYINIFTKNGRNERIYAKLSDIKEQLDSDFLCIHKSYIINTKYFKSLNKSEKVVALNNGQELPISEANYKATVLFFNERKNKYGI